MSSYIKFFIRMSALEVSLVNLLPPHEHCRRSRSENIVGGDRSRNDVSANEGQVCLTVPHLSLFDAWQCSGTDSH